MESESNENERGAAISRGTRRTRREFLPNRAIPFITNSGFVMLQSGEVSPSKVGWKAFGLSALPPQWVPEFLVVSGSVSGQASDFPFLQGQLGAALEGLGLRDATVLVRSSAVAETMEDRGRFDSETCLAAEVIPTIQRLKAKLSSDACDVHWIIQKYILPIRKGHLSNERQMSREFRDWVGEFEIQRDRPGYIFPIAVRHWRDGFQLRDFELSATSEAFVTKRLKSVALWGTEFKPRIHFEWVWSGNEVWIVQADIEKRGVGVNPNRLVPEDISDIEVCSLQVFRTAADKDYKRYKKLRNAQLYRELGYKMPQFFIIDNSQIIEEIVSGRLSERLKYDLQELVKRPIVIRTDGIDIPAAKREMLPRSESLHTFEAAASWLLQMFAPEVHKLGISDKGICLIAHHFIPSAAAAWARAEPQGRSVRIEALWGVPEGLYWYSHDTFEVSLAPSKKDYQVRRRVRFKRTFIAPDKEGRWIHFHPRAPFDWGSSIQDESWILEIAETTARIAEREKRATTVMWFIDNHPKATPHRVLPWYHSDSAIGTPKAAPRRKFTTTSDFTISTSDDWESLQSQVRNGARIERIILDLKDAKLVRNQEFARELAEFAAAHRIVVELAGGILSHAYYMLQRHGAQVECVDLFGADEEVVEYNKLVRDKIPEQIQGRGEAVEISRLRGEALLSALRQKLIEESFEAADAKSFDELVAEMADVLEVLDGICDALQIPREHVVAEQEVKRNRRGGFHKGLMLRRTSTPHSLASKPESQDGTLSLDIPPPMSVIERSEKVPITRPYQRPDLRNVDNQTEAILTFETELSRIREATQNTTFELQLDPESSRLFRLTVEVKRHRSSLWNQVRVRLEPTQLEMKLTSDMQLNLWPDANTEES